MFYPHSQNDVLSDALFLNPPAEYRGAPFWAWNTRLEKETLAEQIDAFAQMGMGGFHMHVRTGMDTPYLSEEFMENIRFCVEEARKKGLRAYLYDEDRWPSGAAGGQVTREHPEFAMHQLVFTPFSYEQLPRSPKAAGGRGGSSTGAGKLLARYDILLSKDGFLENSRLLQPDEAPCGTVWYAYDEVVPASPWVNNAPYIDVFNPRAAACFAEITHEAYYRRFGSDFGSLIPSIFTDEPQPVRQDSLAEPFQKKDLILPWSPDFPERFRARFCRELTAILPEVIWERPEDKGRLSRWQFHEFVTDAFFTSYTETLGAWCEAHGLASTGHYALEDTLAMQAGCAGDVLRGYRGFKVMPGIDLLCDRRTYATPKQVQSAQHQNGAEGSMCELYGVSGWDFDFRGFKLQGDWLAAQGITLRVPHLCWMSMKGEAKRDYPVCIGYQSPWWRKFSLLEDHFARINTALTRGKADVRVGVISPIESYWLFCGSEAQTKTVRDALEQHYEFVTSALLFGLIDFDYISEARLPELCPVGGSPLQVGEMQYDAIIVPGCKTLRSSTLSRLEAFREAGGRLIFLGESPSLLDAVPSELPAALFRKSLHADFDRSTLLSLLEDLRFVDIRVTGRREGKAFPIAVGSRTDHLLYQLRKDGRYRWLFIARGDKPLSPQLDPNLKVRIVLTGLFRVREYDSLSGRILQPAVSYESGRTILSRSWFQHDSLLLRLEEIPQSEASAPMPTISSAVPALPGRSILHKVDYSLSEPNAYLLDMAEWSADGGPFEPTEEFLRLDNICRARIGLPLRQKFVTQPYMLTPEKPSHFVTLRMTVPSEIDAAGVLLALEDAEEAQISWNGQKVTAAPTGWYVDKSLKTVPLPPLHRGSNELLLTWPIGARTNLEYCYLLGSFGVRVEGAVKTVTALPRQLAFGDFTHQGLPFYTGNVLYRMPVEVGASGRLLLRLPQYLGGLAEVQLDGQPAGCILGSPYLFDSAAPLGAAPQKLTPGRHELTVVLYGTRQNGFAQLHHAPGPYYYQDPNSWRSTGDEWQYEYQFAPHGILTSPEIWETL